MWNSFICNDRNVHASINEIIEKFPASTDASSHIKAQPKDNAELDKRSVIFTKENPFYYEAGGQISDKGCIELDGNKYNVEEVIESDTGSIGLTVDTNDLNNGDNIKLIVDPEFRSAVSKSHTAAHIVHSSLRNILGDHVSQAGSHVAPGKFRFDFSHTEKVNHEELDAIFQMSNDHIYKDLIVETSVMNIDKAKDEGALAFFGDK